MGMRTRRRADRIRAALGEIPPDDKSAQSSIRESRRICGNALTQDLTPKTFYANSTLFLHLFRPRG
jgi:hypothetical protein